MQNELPDIYLFNPTCEYAVANGSHSWQPNQLLQKMENDLASLPMFFANEPDYILVDKLPSSVFLENLKNAGFQIPNFCNKKIALKDIDFINLKKNYLKPWGWSPAAHRILEPLKTSCSSDFLNSPVAKWNPELKYFFSRKFALDILGALIMNSGFDFLISTEQVGKICFDKEQVKNCINIWGKVMIKAPWSSSGRGVLPLTKTPVHEKIWEKIQGILSEQGYLIVEPLLNKSVDLAFQFELKSRKVIFKGFSYFKTDYKGRYLGNFLNGIPDFFNSKLSEFIQISSGKIIPELIRSIENSQLPFFYEGNFGVDLLVFTNNNDELRINPCLEINLRNTMGLLALKLEEHIAKNKKGTFNIYYNPISEFNDFCLEMNHKHGLTIKRNKIESGFLPLTEPFSHTKFGAYILV